MNHLLHEVATRTLLKELASRFDHVVFSGIKEITGENVVSEFLYRGDFTQCIGMSHRLAYQVNRDLDTAEVGNDDGRGG